jgi:hypothetical protein
MAKAKLTREQWLNKVAEIAAKDLFKPAGYDVPKNIRYTCGFPSKSALARRNQRIGECWSAGASEDNVFEISVSPVISEGVRAADILVHEMIHATVGLAAGHKNPFVKCARAVGLEGKPTATHAGKELKAKLEQIIKTVGQYPHAGLRAALVSKNTGRGMTKVECAECAADGERYVVRMGEYSLKRGMPLCPVHNVEMVCA